MYYNTGKQVLFREHSELPAEHICDAENEEKAFSIAAHMNSDKYISKALVTLSPSWHGDKVAKNEFIEAINNAIDAANQLDKVKKTLFYGRDNNIDPRPGEASAIDANKIGDMDIGVATNIIHAIIGKFTEAGELLEMMKEAINLGQPFDWVNIKEEVGDGFWYDAILAHECGFSFIEAQDTNIEKLRARFPDKFTEYDAVNRNLAVERKILEGDLPTDIAEQSLPVNYRTRRMEGERNLDGDAIEAQKPKA